jgi:drug/metabolite transporter (DMT)-like permease
MKLKHKAILQMLLCAALWSTGGLFIKLIPWNPFVIAGWRSLVAAATVLVFLRVSKTRFRIDGSSVVMGVFMSLTFLAFVTANKLTTAANAIVLQFTSPLFIVVFSALFFREKFRKGDIFAIFFAMGGIALFFLDSLDPGRLAGNIVAIGAGLVMAAMYIGIGRGSEETRMGGMLMGHLFTALAGIPVMLFTENAVSGPSVLCILALGIIQLGIPYILLVLSSKDCPPLACSLLGALEPLLNPVWVFLFTSEAPGLFALIGGAVVIASVTLWCVWQNRNPAPEEAYAGDKPVSG